jgi:Fur family ferric uptake transcriptional regulator
MDIFKSKDIKCTKQRLEVYEYIEKNNNQTTLKDICENCNNIDKSTIYRILDLFLKKDIIEKNLDNNGEIFYTIKDIDHNHYISCIKCNRLEKISCHIDNDEITEKGFVILNHKMHIDGICENCYKKES